MTGLLATWRSRRTDEAGAVAFMVAILFSSGILLGCVALTVDLGGVTSSRREVQNAADAVALSAAKTCATSALCPAVGDADLADLAADNDADSAVTNLCTNPDRPARGLGACAPVDGSLSDCPTPRAGAEDIDFVRAYTHRTTGLVFGPAIGGPGTKEQDACASAGWGPVGNYTAALPITFSYCEWKFATNGDPLAGTGHFAEGPPYSAADQAVIFLQSKTSGSCPTFNGHDAPGGFGWLDSGDSCGTVVGEDDWIQVDTGNNTPNPCKDLLPTLLNTVIHIPVFDCQNRTPDYPDDPTVCITGGNGSNHYYHMVGFAAFYLTGWHLSSSSQDSTATGRAPCNGGSRCVSGFFVKDTVTGGEIDPDAPSFGLTTIQMIG